MNGLGLAVLLLLGALWFGLALAGSPEPVPESTQDTEEVDEPWLN